MSFDINTGRISEQGLYFQRNIRIAGKTAKTPTKAIPTDKLRRYHEIPPENRSVHEVYRNLDAEDLKEERRGQSTKIRDDLKKASSRVDSESEIVFVFLVFQETRALDRIEAEFLVDLSAEFSDMLVVPIHPRLGRGIRSDEKDEDEEAPIGSAAYHEYRESIELYLEVAKERVPEMPLMGIVPLAGWEYVGELMTMYQDEGVFAYCLNFDDKRITAKTRLGMITPVMRGIARDNLTEEVLTYGINMDTGETDSSLGLKPATDMAGTGIGIDIIGGNHIGMRLPEEVIEDIEQENDTETFDYYDIEEFARKEVPLEDLPQHLPSESSFDPEAVVKKASGSGNSLQKVVNAELMAIATRELQAQINEGDAFDSVSQKRGATPNIQSSQQEARVAFNEGKEQTGLDDFY